jgi:hypothetical protein
MPRLFNADHQAQMVDPDQPAVQPGESHEFTDEQVQAGLTGIWKEGPPRKGLPAQIAKERRAEEAAANTSPDPAVEADDKKE